MPAYTDPPLTDQPALCSVPVEPQRALSHVAIEVVCYAMALAMPLLLRPIIHGALNSEPWRYGAMGAVAVTLVATGICVRVRWPMSWIPACALTGVCAVITSPWHVLTICVAALGLLVLFATEAWPNVDSSGRSKSDGSSGFNLLLLVAASVAVGFGLLRMSILGGFPLSLAHALSSPRSTIVYLRDNAHALDERTPDGLPWVLYAAKHKDPFVLETILQAGARVNGYDWTTLGSPLEWLAANSSFADPHVVAKAKLLVRYGAPARGAAIAARRGHSVLVSSLIELGDDVNTPDAHGVTALGTLIEENAVGAVNCLLSAGVQLLPAYGTLAATKPVTVPSDAMWETLTRFNQTTRSRLKGANL